MVADHWPVPGPPTVRSDFYDLRWSARDKRWVLHGGLDVAVDERRWTKGAPVEAIGGGRVSKIATFRGCSAITVGRFGYGHVRPIRPGSKSATGWQLGPGFGTTCAGEWHVHVTEWMTKGDCEAGIPECRVNPPRPGGLLRLADSWAPEIVEVRRGGDELVARIDDSITQGFLDGSLTPLQVRHRPDRVWVGDRLVFVKRDMHDSPDDVYVGVGSDTKRNVKAGTCLAKGSTEAFACDGTYWLRLGPAGKCAAGCWITAMDTAGNSTRAWIAAPSR